MAKSKSQLPEVYTMTHLEQVRVLADPLRVRILETLGVAERTTKQVAEELGEKPTRLYHHVEALEKVGLIRLSRTRQNRGTVEKYYTAVAKMFRVDSSLFDSGDKEGTETLSEVVTTMMESTAEDLRKLVRTGHDITSCEDALLSYAEIRAPEKEILEFHEKLKTLLRELEKYCCDGERDEDARRYRFTLAYFPLDRSGE